jgi:hypothetical protein
MRRPPPQNTLSTVTSQSLKLKYRITQDDLLWLAKMCAAEGSVESSPALLWALAARFMRFAKRQPGKYPTLTAVAWAFSQPINPIWTRNGSMCRPGGQYHDRADCSEQRLARRDRAVAQTWSNLDSALTDVVGRWGQGLVLNPVPTAANWGATRPLADRTESVADSYLRRTPGAKLVAVYAGNGFIAEVDTKTWSDDHIALVNRDGSTTTTVHTPAPFFVSLARGFARGFVPV